jgi:flavodoxin
MKTLVVYYSRTGHTRTLARQIAVAMGAQIEEIIDHGNRRGILGYLRSGNEASSRRCTEIRRPFYDPGAFDLVITGTPVWRASLCSPVRTYLEAHATKFRNVAFFCTMRWFGSRRVFDQMQTACGARPLATFVSTERQLAGSDLRGAVEVFASRLRASSLPEPVVYKEISPHAE